MTHVLVTMPYQKTHKQYIENIGRCYAEKVKALGAYVIGVTKHKRQEMPACADEMYTMEELPKLLPRADVTVMILPETFERIVRVCGENLGRYLAGDRENMCSQVKRELGY
jgi:hypothetical protein